MILCHLKKHQVVFCVSGFCLGFSFCLTFACVQASVFVSWEVLRGGEGASFSSLKEAWPEAPNDEQPVTRAECFGESRGIVWQFSALEVPSHKPQMCAVFPEITS